MALCTIPGCVEHYGCRLKAKGLQVSVKITGPRSTKPPVFRNAKADPWAKAKATDDRGVPLVRPNGMPVSVKEASEQRHTIKDQHARADAVGLPSATKE